MKAMINLARLYLVIFPFLNSGISVGADHSSLSSGPQVNHWIQGGLLVTNDPFDLGISGDGFFVFEGKGGDKVYSRYGEMALNKEGYLISKSSGHKVVGWKNGRLSPIALLDSPEVRVLSYRISRNGKIWAIYSSGVEETLYTLAIAVFHNPNNLERVGTHLLLETEESGPKVFTEPVTLQAGSIYASSLEDLDEDIYQLNLLGNESKLNWLQIRRREALIGSDSKLDNYLRTDLQLTEKQMEILDSLIMGKIERLLQDSQKRELEDVILR